MCVLFQQETTLVQLMNELIDVCTLGVCFEVHKSLRLGNWELLEGNDKETQNEYGEIYFLL